MNRNTRYLPMLGIALTLLMASTTRAQDVLPANPAAKPYAADLSLLEGLSGRWLGQNSNGAMEAMFGTPRFGQVIGHINYWNDNGYRLLELCSYTERDGSLVYRVKHFDPMMVAAEEKDVATERRLLDYKDGTAYFEDMTVTLTDDTLVFSFNIRGNLIQASYQRAAP
ncbi:MAG: hypothetical protein H6978_16220 [Gammaproteobacteria bacterium]|nr:hypothetical protein [Gammaproteobacteria bacterium]